jgi:hypothetical protein
VPHYFYTNATQCRATGVEAARIAQNAAGTANWYAWGPYLSERQWGTVREDYSADGNAWDYLPHEHARSRAYRWGEDGIAGICDEDQHLCFALALWNGRDEMLKERLFGLTNEQGNHGEDCKELYYYLDAVPSHAYLKMLYKYPQGAFPYAELVQKNRERGKHDPEYELLDTGLFDEDRYFDVSVEYAKADVDDLLMRIQVVNRGPEARELTLLPQLWFRNTWSWHPDAERPLLTAVGDHRVKAIHAELGDYELYFGEHDALLFTENESNPRLWGDEQPCDEQRNGPFKDAFHDYLIEGRRDAVADEPCGTKCAVLRRLELSPGESASMELRLSATSNQSHTRGPHDRPFFDFDEIVCKRRAEADAFYETLQKGMRTDDGRLVQRQAIAGLIWSKQFYYYDVERWIDGDEEQPTPPERRRLGRNYEWRHLNNADVISMPDKWEYPWYAAWDLAFHCLPIAVVDAHFAKAQLELMVREWYMHPNGQLPAYEWAFSDVNPPVHAWATWRVYQIDRKQRGDNGDRAFLERVFHKLMLNFTWWVNRKDAEGHNIFQGGFLGLDNIGVFDRSKPLPTGGYLNQSDGTAWMAMYSLNLMRIALELAKENDVYEDIATKFFEHFLHIAEAMSNIADEGIGLWDEEDRFYYDVLALPEGDRVRHVPIRLRSLVGLIPLFAVETLEPALLDEVPGFKERLEWVLENKPKLAELVSHWEVPGRGHRRLLSLLRGSRMKALLRRMLDPNEFLSDYGIRGLSKVHEATPYVFEHAGQRHEVAYTPAESPSRLFGGNSNWRGPIWFPVNFLLIESLQKFHHYYGDDFKIECPTGSDRYCTLDQAATELCERLCHIFLKDEQGRRAVYANCEKHQSDPHFRDYIQFYEYFHGDSGRGVGASHQTGWTALVAKILLARARPRASNQEPLAP